MKTIINKGSDRLELFKQILYSVQVIIAGIALPLLFLVSTSGRYQKKSTDFERRTNDQIHEFNYKNNSIPCWQEMNEVVKISPHIVDQPLVLNTSVITKFNSNPFELTHIKNK